jgi:uncharacterized protein (DUF697 family)
MTELTRYEKLAMSEMRSWQQKMQRSPSLRSRVTKNIQTRINRAIPEKVHEVITGAIKQMINAVLTGAEFINPSPSIFSTLEETETQVRKKIEFYKNTAAAEGAITGAGGILLGLADFPLWLSIKMKLLFEIATLYGRDVSDFKERVYILYVFQLAFSSQQHRNTIYHFLKNWEEYSKNLDQDSNQFDWRTFQQEYRDYIDLAKLIQLIPGIGAVVGAYVNHRLTDQLGETAINAYRMRWKKV